MTLLKRLPQPTRPIPILRILELPVFILGTIANDTQTPKRHLSRFNNCRLLSNGEDGQFFGTMGTENQDSFDIPGAAGTGDQ